jgi:D-alanyl-D-alanine carboxypeptidase
MKRLIFILLLAVSSLVSANTVTATSWLVADGEGRVVGSHNPNEQRSIASITKLMTAMVILDAKQDPSEKIKGQTREQLLQLMLVHSDNHAAEVLCENYPGGRASCITAMNRKAYALGLDDTHYADPSGLNIMNVSTASELVYIVMEASKYPEINKAAKTSEIKIQKRKRAIALHNTNPLVAKEDFVVSKTGYIHASGGCIVMMVNTKIGQRIVVLLNSKNTHTRIPEAYSLAMNF